MTSRRRVRRVSIDSRLLKKPCMRVEGRGAANERRGASKSRVELNVPKTQGLQEHRTKSFLMLPQRRGGSTLASTQLGWSDLTFAHDSVAKVKREVAPAHIRQFRSPNWGAAIV